MSEKEGKGEKEKKKFRGLRCSICGKFFKNAQGLASHVANVHYGGFKSTVDKFYKFVEMVGDRADGKRLLEIGKELEIAPSTIEYFLGKIRDIGAYRVFSRDTLNEMIEHEKRTAVGEVNQKLYRVEEINRKLQRENEELKQKVDHAYQTIKALRDDLLNVAICKLNGKIKTFGDLLIMMRKDPHFELFPEWEKRADTLLQNQNPQQ